MIIYCYILFHWVGCLSKWQHYCYIQGLISWAEYVILGASNDHLLVTCNIFYYTVTETETITIKQENGLLLQYELPVEHDPQGQWTRTLVKTPNTSVVTKAPGPRKRGRPRKYLNDQGQIGKSNKKVNLSSVISVDHYFNPVYTTFACKIGAF